MSGGGQAAKEIGRKAEKRQGYSLVLCIHTQQDFLTEEEFLKMRNKTFTRISLLMLCLVMIFTVIPLANIPASAYTVTGTLHPTGYVTLLHGSRSLDSVGYVDRILTYSDTEAQSTSLGSIRFDISNVPANITMAEFSFEIQKVSSNNTNEVGVYVAMQNENVPALNNNYYYKDTATHTAVFGTTFGANSSTTGNAAKNYYNAQEVMRIGGAYIGTSYAVQTINITDALKAAKAKGLTTLNMLFFHPSSDAANADPWTDIHVKPSSSSIIYEAEEHVRDFSGIKTNELNTNVTLSYGTFINDNDYIAPEHYAQTYKNVLWATRGVGGSNYIDGYTAYSGEFKYATSGNKFCSSHDYWFNPTTVFLYDEDQNGNPLPMLTTVMFTFDPDSDDVAAGWANDNRLYAAFTSNPSSDGISMSGDWKGHDSRFNCQWLLLQAPVQTSTGNPKYWMHGENLGNSDGSYTYKFTEDYNDDEYLYANGIKCTYNMSDTEYKKKIVPIFSALHSLEKKTYFGYSTATSSAPLYLVNYVPLKAALEDAIAQYNRYKDDVAAHPFKYTPESIEAFANAVNGLIAAKPDNYDYSANTEEEVNLYATNAAAAVNAWNDARELVEITSDVNYDNLFSFTEFMKNVSYAHNITNMTCDVSAGSFTMTTGGDDVEGYTTEYTIPVKTNTEYIIGYTADTPSGVQTQIFTKVDGDYTSAAGTAGTGVKTTHTFTTGASTQSVNIRFDVNASNQTGKFYNIWLAEKKYADKYDLANRAKYRDLVTATSFWQPTREDYNFVSWCNDEALTTPVTAPNQLNNSTILYSKWDTVNDINYDSYFSFSEWANTHCTEADASGKAEIDVANGSFTYTPGALGGMMHCNQRDEFYHVNVEPGEKYILQYDVSNSTGFVAVKYLNNGNLVDAPNADGNDTAYIWGGGAAGTKAIDFTAPSDKVWIAFGTAANNDSELAPITFSNISIYKLSDDDKIVGMGDSYKVRDLVTVGTALSTPTREGYTFGGWYTDRNFTNRVTDASTLSDSATVFSKWTPNKYTIKFVNKAGNVVSSAEYDYGTAASAIVKPANTAVAKDNDKHYSYSWPTISDVTGDKTYNEVETPAPHTWNSGEVTTQPTCTGTGVKTYTCTFEGCGATYTEAVDAKGHGATKIENKVEPTCGKDGYTGDTYCTVCSLKIADGMTDPATGNHSWGVGAETQAPTCTGDGTMTYTCTVCGGIKTEPIAHPGHKEEIIPATGATCTTSGKTEGKKCSVCGEILLAQTDIYPLDHDWDEGKVTTEPKCGVKGEKTFNCTRCSETKTEEVAALEHTGGEANCQKGAICELCGVEYTQPVAHKYITLVVVDGTHHRLDCRYCGLEGTVEECNFSEYKAHSPVIGCVEDGYDLYQCTLCSNTTKKNIVSAPGHTIEILPGTPATCLTSGLTEGQKCSDCQETIVAQNVIDPLGHTPGAEATCLTAQICTICNVELTEAKGHTFGEVVPRVDSTCSATGNYAYKQCTACQLYFDESAAVDSERSYDSPSATGLVIPKKPHTFSDPSEDNVVWTISDEKKPTLATLTLTCAKCSENETYTARYDYWEIEELTNESVAGTCASPSSKKYKATFYTSPYFYAYKTIEGEIDASEHTSLEKIDAQEATCETAGNIQHWYCSACGGYFTDDAGTVATTSEKVIIAALGHSYTVVVDNKNGTHHYKCSRCDAIANAGDCDYSILVAEKAPTCTEKGYKTYKCSVCSSGKTDILEMIAHTAGAVVVENENAATCTTTGSYDNVVYCSVCNTEMSRETVTTEMIAHTAGAVVVENEKAATCTATGSYDNVVYCSVCNTEMSRETVTTDMIAHDYVAVVTAPTCTAKGYTTYTCSVCSDSYTADETEMIAHTAGAEATCTEDQICTVCKAVLKEKLGHDIENHDAKAPTCTEIGWEAYETCSRHDYTTYVEIKPLGHIDETPVDGYCDREECQEDICKHLDYTLKVDEPTCTKDGMAYKICKVCKLELSATVIPAKGHSEVITEVGATCQEYAHNIITCANCDQLNEKVYTGNHFAPHSWVIIPGKAPTCTSEGYSDYSRCMTCATIEESAKIPIVPHTDSDNNEVCDTCGGKYISSSKACGCICHNDNFIMVILYKIAHFFWKLFKINKSCNCGTVHY